jgi:hypothetical protein
MREHYGARHEAPAPQCQGLMGDRALRPGRYRSRMLIVGDVEVTKRVPAGTTVLK